jgi:hypothetical protein
MEEIVYFSILYLEEGGGEEEKERESNILLFQENLIQYCQNGVITCKMLVLLYV